MAGLHTFTKRHLTFISQELSKHGFRIMSTSEQRKLMKKLKPIAPRVQNGSNIPMVLYLNGLTILIWTSFDRSKNKTLEGKCAWVLVLDGAERIFSSPQIRRYEHSFIPKLLHWARIAKAFADARPNCSQCDDFITMRKNDQGIREGVCENTEFHKDKKEQKISWIVNFNDLPLDLKPFKENLLDYLEFYDSTQESYISWRKEHGLEIHKIGSTRNNWMLGNPHNA